MSPRGQRPWRDGMMGIRVEVQRGILRTDSQEAKSHSPWLQEEPINASQENGRKSGGQIPMGQGGVSVFSCKQPEVSEYHKLSDFRIYRKYSNFVDYSSRGPNQRHSHQRARFLKCMMDINIVEWRGHVRMKAGRHVSTISPLNAFLVNIHSNSQVGPH